MLVARIGPHVLHLRDPAEVQQALLALYRIDCAMLEALPGHFPRLFDSGVVWQLERDPREAGGEDWLTLRELYDGRETADCEDIAAARAAESTVLDGRPAVPRLTFVPGGYHIVVEYDDGTWEDPSELLGMGRPVDLGRVEAGARRRAFRAIRGLGRGLWHAAQDVPVLGPALDAVETVARSTRDELELEDALVPDVVFDADGEPMMRLEDESDDDERRAVEVGALW